MKQTKYRINFHDGDFHFHYADTPTEAVMKAIAAKIKDDGKWDIASVINEDTHTRLTGKIEIHY